MTDVETVTDEALAKSLFGDPKLAVDLKAILEHARGLFQYHADQRIRAIQYFFFAYAAFATAYTGIFKLNASQDTHLVQLVLCMLALVVSVGFWILDRRNVQLVEINEAALIDLERAISYQFKLQSYKMTARSNDTPCRYLVRYGVVVNVLFLVIVSVTFLATLYEAKQVFCPK